LSFSSPASVPAKFYACSEPRYVSGDCKFAQSSIEATRGLAEADVVREVVIPYGSGWVGHGFRIELPQSASGR
jgi:hypothetical protein